MFRKNYIFLKIDEDLNDEQWEELKKRSEDRPIFIKHKKYETWEQAEELGFQTLDERISNQWFFRYRPERKNIYVYETEPFYVDHIIEKTTFVLELLESIEKKYKKLEIQAILAEDAAIYLHFFEFRLKGEEWNSRNRLTITYADEFYDFFFHGPKERTYRMPEAAENKIKEKIFEIFEKIIQKG